MILCGHEIYGVVGRLLIGMDGASSGTYLRFVGKTSVMRQSREAFPIEITPLKTAETARFWCLFVTRYIEAEQRPADIVLNTRKNFLPSLSMNRTAITFAGRAAATVISDSRKTVLGMVAEQTPVSE
uniref:(northern house mosquito) hypothetical protein n=1 Tax=Culex pipiens TaxID=7175 RepID=A0A8D8GNX6_CULPI